MHTHFSAVHKSIYHTNISLKFTKQYSTHTFNCNLNNTVADTQLTAIHKKYNVYKFSCYSQSTFAHTHSTAIHKTLSHLHAPLQFTKHCSTHTSSLLFTKLCATFNTANQQQQQQKPTKNTHFTAIQKKGDYINNSLQFTKHGTT